MRKLKALKVNAQYTRHDVAAHTGYNSWRSLARGIVSPSDADFMLLFITGDGSVSAGRYSAKIHGSRISMTGRFRSSDVKQILKSPPDRYVHLFFRSTGGQPFTYRGKVQLHEPKRGYSDTPKELLFDLPSSD